MASAACPVFRLRSENNLKNVYFFFPIFEEKWIHMYTSVFFLINQESSVWFVCVWECSCSSIRNMFYSLQ